MPTLSYVVRDSEIDPVRNGTTQTLDIALLPRADLRYNPQGFYSASMDHRSGYGVLVSEYDTLTLSEDAIEPTQALYWREMMRSVADYQLITVGCFDVPSIRKTLQCRWIDNRQWGLQDFAWLHWQADIALRVLNKVSAVEQALTLGVADATVRQFNDTNPLQGRTFIFGFTGGTQDLSFDFEAFNAIGVNDIEVSLNGQLLGYAPVGGANAWSASSTVSVPATKQLPGENLIVVKTLVSDTAVWGVRNALLRA